MITMATDNITPPEAYFNRRTVMKGGLVAAGMVATGWLYRRINGVDLVETDSPVIPHLERPGRYVVEGEAMTPFASVTNYNNFYEFTTDKDGVAKASRDFKTSGWKVEVGGLVGKPKTFDMDDLRRLAPTEERVYRMRCVEAWSMVVPWAGYSLSKLLAAVQPTSDAKYVAFETLNDPVRMPGLASTVLKWPYVEGLRLRRGDASARAPDHRPLRPRSAAAGRRPGPPDHAMEVRLQGHQVDRQDHPDRHPAAHELAGVLAERVRLLRERQPDARAPALEPGHRAAHRRGPGAAPRSRSTATATRSRASTRAWISMSSSSVAVELPRAAASRAFIDGAFVKRFAILCGLVPGVLLAWDAWRGNLGINAVNYAIHSTGMLGLVFMTASLAITPLRRLTGWTWLLSARRNLGVYGFGYILTHFMVFFVLDREADVGSTLDEIISRVYLWFGTASLVIMIPLAITSTDGMVTRLGAKRWKWLHRLAYVAVFCGVVHFYLEVKSDTSRPFAFAVVFGALMVYRIGTYERKNVAKPKPKKPAAAPAKKKFWSGELRVARIFQETPDVRTFRFVMPDGSPLPFEHLAGQYLNLALTIDGKRVNRSYTIASPPTRTHSVEISVKRAPAGHGSWHMHDTVKEGDVIKVSAPAGKFFFAGHEAKRIVLVAGGVGITPMMSVIRSLTDRCWTGEMYLLFAVRKRTDIIFEKELAELQQRFGNLHVCIALSDDPDTAWDGKRGRISREMIEAFVPDLTTGPIMMCGPDPMMKATRKLLLEMGIPNERISEEEFVSPPPPAAGAPEPVEPQAAPGGVVNLRFTKADKTIDSELTVLEAAEECGVEIPFECRSGICGQCKCKLVSGRVAMDSQDALTASDRARGLILACQARPVGDVVIDA